MLVFKPFRVTKEEIPEAPNWINRLLEPLNFTMQTIWSLFQNLTIGDNVIGQWVTLTINTSATYSSGDFPRTVFQWRYGKAVEGVFVGQVRKQGNPTVNTQPITVDWAQTSQGVEVKYVTGLANSETYTIRFLAL